MAIAFNTSTTALEEELISLILDGQIQARIDSQNKVYFKYFCLTKINLIETSLLQILYRFCMPKI